MNLHRSDSVDVTRSLSPAGKCIKGGNICWSPQETGVTAGFPLCNVMAYLRIASGFQRSDCRPVL